MDDVTLTQAAILAGTTAVAAMLVGLAMGRHRANRGNVTADWKMRLATRDRDLSDAVDRLIEAELALQDALKAQERDPDAGIRARVAALAEELTEAEDELTRLRALGVDRAPVDGSVARRLETLEAELATLESLRCPDPSAHRRRGATEPQEDDLTRITGVGRGLAEILRDLGYRTFEDVAGMTDDDLAAITDLAGGIAGPASREAWVRSARRLADESADRADDHRGQV